MEMRAYRWPGEARLAVMMTVMFEAWSDGKGPPYSPMASPLRPGTVDTQGISWGEYGGRTGVARFLRLFERFGVRASFAVNARAAERFPEAVRAIVAGGHEIAGHGDAQDLIMGYLSIDEERELIRRCTETLTAVGGVRPVGWRSPRVTASAHTAELLAEAGYRWHGDYSDADLPYLVTTARGPIVALPHSDWTDNRVLRASPRTFFEVYRDTATYLHRDEPGGLINLTVHAHFGARPPMAAMLVEILEHVRGLGDVWFARHDEVAAHVLQHEAPAGSAR